MKKKHRSTSLKFGNNLIDGECAQILKLLEIYYEIYDLEHLTNLCLLFKTLYQSDEAVNYKVIAERFYIDIKILYNYREKFNKLTYELL